MRRLLITALALCFVWSCGRAPKVVQLSGQTMGTTYNISVVGGSCPLDSGELEIRVSGALDLANKTFSNWDPTSEVSKFNEQRASEPVLLSARFQELMQTADEIHAATDGYFDLTAAPLIELWGFFKPNFSQDLPSAEDIAAAKARTGQAQVISFDAANGTLEKIAPDAVLHLAAIAKGTGIDMVAETIGDAGCTDFMVEIGGDLFVAGKNAAGDDWRIGVERPDARALKVDEIVSLSDLGMATSGDYRNYREKDGVRYSHIIDMQTGRPVTHATASVTVLAESAALADAWATALLALGRARGMKIADEYNIAALFIDRAPKGDEKSFVTAPSSAYIQLQGVSQD